MFTAKNIAITLMVIGGSMSVPVIPSNTTLLYSFQTKQSSYTIPTQTATSSIITDSPTTFVDDDNNGVISISVFVDNWGNKIYIQIPDEQYKAMGEINGYSKNPDYTEYVNMFTALTPVANAAIAFDAATSATDVSSGSSITYSHTVTGSNPALVVGFFVFNATDPGVSSVTYAGSNMTALSGSPTSHQSNMRVYMYYKLGPATGANNVVITLGASVTQLASMASSYTGVNQSAIDASNTTTNSVATASITLTATTIADNSWVVGFERNEAGNATDGANTTHRTSVQNDRSIFDSNGPVTPAGSRSLIQNFTSAKNSGLIISLAPAATASFNPYFLQEF